MDQIVQSYAANNSFMGSVLVARDAQVLFSKGYGSANLEWNVPNAPDTKFRLGSVTKQFTAASILLLEERGKLSVNDPVKKYLPDAPAACSTSCRRLSLRTAMRSSSSASDSVPFIVALLADTVACQPLLRLHHAPGGLPS